jgi:molybdopterin synthase catalytic subunit
VTLVAISTEPLSAAEHLAAVEGPARGACVLFTGEVRDHDHDREVVELEYVGHPSADQVLREVAAEVAADLTGGEVAVSHRVGVLKVGDLALVAAVSAAHREEAFEACRQLVEQVKHRLPVWKRQAFADGSHEWVNCP